MNFSEKKKTVILLMQKQQFQYFLSPNKEDVQSTTDGSKCKSPSSNEPYKPSYHFLNNPIKMNFELIFSTNFFLPNDTLTDKIKNAFLPCHFPNKSISNLIRV